jgi:hypothetical protein
MMDMFDRNVGSWEILKFMWKYPKSISQFLPFYFSKKHGFVYDINLIIIYLMVIIAIGVGIFFAF